MKYKERVMKALKSDNKTASDIDKIIEFAYWMGREAEAKAMSNKIRPQLEEQKERAAACRYHNMAAEVVGTIDCYSPNYSGDFTTTFGDDQTNL